jgi:hypothetical protein
VTSLIISAKDLTESPPRRRHKGVVMRPAVRDGRGGEDLALPATAASAVPVAEALFLHPFAELRQQQLEGPDLTPRDFQEVTQLGVPFKIVDGVVSPFRLEVARRIGAINSAPGLPADAPLPAADRARVRTEVACEFFLAAHDREPMDARELAAQIDVLPG